MVERQEIAQLQSRPLTRSGRRRAGSDRINRNRAALSPVFKAAAEFQRLAGERVGKPLTSVASSTMEALMAFAREGAAVAAPVGEARAPVLNVYADIQRQAAALGGVEASGR